MSRSSSAPGQADRIKWGEWRHDRNIPAHVPKPDDDDWRIGEIARIRREIEISRVEEERLSQELRSNERILRHNLNELRHWKAAIQSRDEELVRRHDEDRERMRKFMIHYKMRLDKERGKLQDSLLKCVQSSRTISAVLQSCAVCEYELKGEECPECWADRFPVEPPIFERCLQARSHEGRHMAEEDNASDLNKSLTLQEAPHLNLGRSVETKSIVSDGRSSFGMDSVNDQPRGSMAWQEQGAGNMMRMGLAGMQLPLGDPARDSGFWSNALSLHMRPPQRGGELAADNTVSVGADGRRSR